MAYNIASAAITGVGPVEYDGTTWLGIGPLTKRGLRPRGPAKPARATMWGPLPAPKKDYG